MGRNVQGLAVIGRCLTVAVAAGAAITGASSAHATAAPRAAAPLVLSDTVDVSPSRITFGSQEAGTTSSSRTVQVTNNTAADLTFNGIFINQGDNTDFSITHTGCGHVLASGAHCSIDVAFRPAEGTFGPRSSTLEIDDDGPNSPQSVTLIGRVESPNVDVEPSDISFGAFLPGQISPEHTVTLTNHGSGDLTITDVKLDPTDDFNILAGDCLGDVKSGASCTVDVVYSPKTSQGDVKAIRTAVLAFTDNDPETPSQLVSLDGTVPTPLVEVSPSAIDFGRQAAGTKSASRAVTLRNTGSGTMQIQAIEMKGLDPDDFNVTSNGCGGTLRAGDGCSLSIDFAPQKADGALSALLTFTDDAPTVTQTVALRGVAAPGGAAPAPGGAGAPGGPAAPVAPAATTAAPAVAAPAATAAPTPASTPAPDAVVDAPAVLTPGPATASSRKADTHHSAAAGDDHGLLVGALLAAVSGDGMVLRTFLTVVLAILPFAVVVALGWWGRRLWMRRIG